MMSTPQNAEVIEAGVYDTSRGVSRSNWQWGNVRFDESWKAAAALIHQGWPAEQRVFTDQQAVLLGVIRHSEFVWLYRVYPAGRDEHGRPGRYFFALVRLLSLDGITHPQVAGLLAYFEKERGLPLNTKPLEGGWPDAEPNSTLAQLRKDLEENSRFGHWGMDGAGRMIRLLDPEPAKKETAQVPPFTGRGKLIIGAGVLVAGAIGYFLIPPPVPVEKAVDESGTKTIPTPPPLPETTSKTSDPNSDLEPNETNGDEQVPRESIDSQPELIPKDKPPLDPDPLTKENDGSVPPNQTPNHSL